MKGKKKPVQDIIYVVFLLGAMFILFYWYTVQNRERINEQNKNYAADSARLKAVQINDEFNNALDLIKTYSYFISKSLEEPVVTSQMLKEMEGTTYASDGRTASQTQYDYYQNGIKGESGISVVFNSNFSNETMVGFYTPLMFEGEIIGVLRGAYLADVYLQDMLDTSYFGEEAGVFLCMPDGMVIASSSHKRYKEDLAFILEDSGTLDKDTADNIREIFKNGSEGVFNCGAGSKTDNFCVLHIPDSGYVLVQVFPKSVTQRMVNNANRTGIRLEIMLMGYLLFILLYL